MGNAESLMDALLGREQWILEDTGYVETHRFLNGFFGSPLREKNRHVSAVLYKHLLPNARNIANQWTSTAPDSGYSQFAIRLDLGTPSCCYESIPGKNIPVRDGVHLAFRYSDKDQPHPDSEPSAGLAGLVAK